jgi:hypothetical protein
MSAFLSNISLVVTSIMGWVVTVCETITGQPILLFTVGFLAIGGAVGIFGRLLSRN